MPRSPRALLLDLDDTLYARRRFLLSGFAAVARHVAERCSVDAAQAFLTLVRAHRGEARGRELDRLVATLDEAAAGDVTVDGLIRLIRLHSPQLRLAPRVARTLDVLRGSWKLAIVTNGLPSVQARKVAALGVDGLVNAVIFASEHGIGVGKPESAPFHEALRRLGVDSANAVFVGDDETADIEGAARCGMATIRTVEWLAGQARHPATRNRAGADAVIDSITQLPEVAARVLSEKRARHAA